MEEFLSPYVLICAHLCELNKCRLILIKNIEVRSVFREMYLNSPPFHIEEQILEGKLITVAAFLPAIRLNCTPNSRTTLRYFTLLCITSATFSRKVEACFSDSVAFNLIPSSHPLYDSWICLPVTAT